MVFSPKNSQKVMSWCVESAIGLIFKVVGQVDKKISRHRMRQYFHESAIEFNVSKKKIDQTIYDLKRRNYISFGEGDSVILTNKAKIKIIDQIAGSATEDNHHRLVSFDIPETKRSNRDNFRRAIKRMGFRQIQKSLWVSNKNIGDLVEAAASEYEVSDYVAYFVAEKSNIDRFINSILNKHSD